eukprot:92441_1
MSRSPLANPLKLADLTSSNLGDYSDKQLQSWLRSENIVCKKGIIARNDLEQLVRKQLVKNGPGNGGGIAEVAAPPAGPLKKADLTSANIGLYNSKQLISWLSSENIIAKRGSTRLMLEDKVLAQLTRNKQTEGRSVSSILPRPAAVHTPARASASVPPGRPAAPLSLSARRAARKKRKQPDAASNKRASDPSKMSRADLVSYLRTHGQPVPTGAHRTTILANVIEFMQNREESSSDSNPRQQKRPKIGSPAAKPSPSPARSGIPGARDRLNTVVEEAKDVEMEPVQPLPQSLPVVQVPSVVQSAPARSAQPPPALEPDAFPAVEPVVEVPQESEINFEPVGRNDDNEFQSGSQARRDQSPEFRQSPIRRAPSPPPASGSPGFRQSPIRRLRDPPAEEDISEFEIPDSGPAGKSDNDAQLSGSTEGPTSEERESSELSSESSSTTESDSESDSSESESDESAVEESEVEAAAERKSKSASVRSGWFSLRSLFRFFCVAVVVCAAFITVNQFRPRPIFCDSGTPGYLRGEENKVCLTCPREGLCRNGVLSCRSGDVLSRDGLRCAPSKATTAATAEVAFAARRFLGRRRGAWTCGTAESFRVPEKELAAYLHETVSSYYLEKFDEAFARFQAATESSTRGIIHVEAAKGGAVWWSDAEILSWKCLAQQWASANSFEISIVAGFVGVVAFVCLQIRKSMNARRKVKELYSMVEAELIRAEEHVVVDHLREMIFPGGTDKIWGQVTSRAAKDIRIVSFIRRVDAVNRICWKWAVAKHKPQQQAVAGSGQARGSSQYNGYPSLSERNSHQPYPMQPNQPVAQQQKSRCLLM